MSSQFVYVCSQTLQEYRSEGISFEDIPFVDNQVCLDLIEGKRGIMPELDQQVLYADDCMKHSMFW